MVDGVAAAARILKVLRFSPRGLTIADISRKTGLNRNLAAKQLEVMHAEGKVDLREVGSARVYSLSQRVPLSAFLCFTRNLIVILDNGQNIVQVNGQYERFSGMRKEDMVGRNLQGAGLPVVSTPESLAIIGSVRGDQVITEIQCRKGTEDLDFRMEVIPTTFEAGDAGLTIVLQDITEQKRHLRNTEFLARTAMELVDFPADADIFEYIGERVAELVPGRTRVYVELYDEVRRQFIFEAMVGPEFREGAKQLAGFDLVGMTFPIREFFFAAPFFESPSTLKSMREMRFKPFYDEEPISFYHVCAGQFPQEVCDAFLQRFNIAKIYLTGLVWQEQLYGIVGIGLGREEELFNRQAIESFLRQASIAISRRIEGERLARSERRFADLLECIGKPALVTGTDGRVLIVNHRFRELTGYTPEEIPTVAALLEKAFPEAGNHGVAEAVLGPGTPDPAGRAERIMPFRCRDGNVIQTAIGSTVLTDGTRVFSLGLP